jgi:ribosomal protein L32E
MFMIRKKPHPKFNVPNYGAKSRSRVKERWRKQRGIDNKKRIKMAMMGAEPTIGYRNPEAIRHLRASGRRAAQIRNVKDMNDFVERKMGETHDAIVAHSVSKRVRRQMLEIAKKHNVRIANVSAKSVERERKPEKAKVVKAEADRAKQEAAKAIGQAKPAEAPKDEADKPKPDEGVSK